MWKKYYSGLRKEGNPAIFENMDGHWGHYHNWQKSDKKVSSIWYHLYVESKNVKHIGTENRLMFGRIRRWGVGNE